MKAIRRFSGDRYGKVVTTELLLVAAVAAIGLVAGLATLQSQVLQELTDLSASLDVSNQSYQFSSLRSSTAATAGSGFLDGPDTPVFLAFTSPDPGGGDGDDDDGDDDGDDDDDDDDDDDGQPGTPRTQGYWKNHPADWPVDSLTLGDQTYSQQELLDLLNTPVGGKGGADASLILAHQLIAAKLNIAAGVNADSISNVVSEADSLLGGFQGKLPYDVAPSTGTGQAAVSAATALDDFNNGR